jgi:metallopeptidase family M12-like protein
MKRETHLTGKLSLQFFLCLSLLFAHILPLHAESFPSLLSIVEGNSSSQTSAQIDLIPSALSLLQPVSINRLTAKEVPSSVPVLHTPLKLSFTLPDGTVHLCTLDITFVNRSGSRSWQGYVEGVLNSSVSLVIKDDILTGNLNLNNSHYSIRYNGSGTHHLTRINPEPSINYVDPEPVFLPTLPTPMIVNDFLTPSDTPVIIDVMVVYTEAARIAEGGTSSIETLIDLAIQETNTSYANSGISQRINLVHTAEVVYTQSATGTTDDVVIDRNRLQHPSDGYMDEVHTLRDLYQADLVALLTTEYTPTMYGVAYGMTNPTTNFAPFGFCVVASNYAAAPTFWMLGHEFGHLMGAWHEWYYYDPVPVAGPYSYNYATVNTANLWKTIMSHGGECVPATGFPCTRILYWSNPDLSYNGVPMGIAEGEPEAADHRKTLNNTALTVANFRMNDPAISPSCALATPLDTDSGHAGIMFDITALNDTTIYAFSPDFSGAGTVSRVEVYYRNGGISGHELDPTAWLLAGSANDIIIADTSNGQFRSHLPIDMNVSIKRGETYGFYITVADRVAGPSLRYNTGTSIGTVTIEDSAVQIKEGLGMEYLFGESFGPRAYSGIVHHSCDAAMQSLASVNPPNQLFEGIMFDVRAKQDLTLHGFSSYISFPREEQMEIYYRRGTHIGHEDSPADWMLLGSVQNLRGYVDLQADPPLMQSRIPMDIDLVMRTGELFAFYLTDTKGMSTVNFFKEGDTVIGDLAYADDSIEIFKGTAKGYPFGFALPFARIFSGTIHYSPIPPSSSTNILFLSLPAILSSQTKQAQ